MALANRWVTTRQLGFLLGFMGPRVLGQYDLALLSRRGRRPAGSCSSRRTSAQTAHALDVPLGPFRTWIALHETTHAFEFEAHPWLRPYLAERLERQLTPVQRRGARRSGRDALRGPRPGAPRRGDGGEHWMERLMGDEQRRLFRETQAVMSLLEGFSDYVMDEVGADLVPDVERISARFHERRQRATPFERAVLRLTGMDLKLEQYAKGERVRPGHRRGRRAGRRWPASGTARRRCRATARSTTRRWIARVLGADGGRVTPT